MTQDSFVRQNLSDVEQSEATLCRSRLRSVFFFFFPRVCVDRQSFVSIKRRKRRARCRCVSRVARQCPRHESLDFRLRNFGFHDHLSLCDLLSPTFACKSRSSSWDGPQQKHRGLLRACSYPAQAFLWKRSQRYASLHTEERLDRLTIPIRRDGVRVHANTTQSALRAREHSVISSSEVHCGMRQYNGVFLP
jgi:hypothetical protein